MEQSMFCLKVTVCSETTGVMLNVSVLGVDRVSETNAGPLRHGALRHFIPCADFADGSDWPIACSAGKLMLGKF